MDKKSQMWHTPATPALGRWRQEDGKFEASLNYTSAWLHRETLSQKGEKKKGSNN
jgi:hypothetical protein